MEKVTAAAVQATPVFPDREATVDKACRLIEEAGAGGAGLVVFPETFVPTYPDWVWVSIGVNERDPAGSTLYNTQLYVGPDGAVAAKHRKLMPPAVSGSSGAWATVRPWPWSTPRSGASAA